MCKEASNISMVCFEMLLIKLYFRILNYYLKKDSMKKPLYFSLLIVAMIFIGASKNSKLSDKTFSIIPEETIVGWTAYKTTSKIPVSGIFKEVIIDSDHSGITVYKAIDRLKFSLPISSIFSQSSLRDKKIKNSFFGSMLNTTKISGEISLSKNNLGFVKITMNGISKELPITFKIDGELVVIDAVMDLNNWESQVALDALSEACEDLHSGPDGETLTWSEVKINVTSKVRFD